MPKVSSARRPSSLRENLFKVAAANFLRDEQKNVKAIRRDSVLDHTTSEDGKFRHRMRRGTLSEQPYRMQGNQQMYTPDMLQQRGILRHHEGIRKTIKKFWSLFPIKEASKGLKRNQFVSLIIAFSKVLDRTFTLEGANKIALGEWHRDSYKGGMNEAQFFESLFELVDVWTETVEPQEYVDFLETLFKKVTNKRAVNSSKGVGYVYTLRSLDQIRGIGGTKASKSAANVAKGMSRADAIKVDVDRRAEEARLTANIYAKANDGLKRQAISKREELTEAQKMQFFLRHHRVDRHKTHLDSKSNRPLENDERNLRSEVAIQRKHDLQYEFISHFFSSSEDDVMRQMRVMNYVVKFYKALKKNMLAKRVQRRREAAQRLVEAMLIDEAESDEEEDDNDAETRLTEKLLNAEALVHEVEHELGKDDQEQFDDLAEELNDFDDEFDGTVSQVLVELQKEAATTRDKKRLRRASALRVTSMEAHSLLGPPESARGDATGRRKRGSVIGAQYPATPHSVEKQRKRNSVMALAPPGLRSRNLSLLAQHSKLRQGGSDGSASSHTASVSISLHRVDEHHDDEEEDEKKDKVGPLASDGELFKNEVKVPPGMHNRRRSLAVQKNVEKVRETLGIGKSKRQLSLLAKSNPLSRRRTQIEEGGEVNATDSAFNITSVITVPLTGAAGDLGSEDEAGGGGDAGAGVEAASSSTGDAGRRTSILDVGSRRRSILDRTAKTDAKANRAVPSIVSLSPTKSDRTDEDDKDVFMADPRIDPALLSTVTKTLSRPRGTRGMSFISKSKPVCAKKTDKAMSLQENEARGQESVVSEAGADKENEKESGEKGDRTPMSPVPPTSGTSPRSHVSPRTAAFLAKPALTDEAQDYPQSVPTSSRFGGMPVKVGTYRAVGAALSSASPGSTAAESVSKSESDGSSESELKKIRAQEKRALEEARRKQELAVRQKRRQSLMKYLIPRTPSRQAGDALLSSSRRSSKISPQRKFSVSMAMGGVDSLRSINEVSPGGDDGLGGASVSPVGRAPAAAGEGGAQVGRRAPSVAQEVAAAVEKRRTSLISASTSASSSLSSFLPSINEKPGGMVKSTKKPPARSVRQMSTDYGADFGAGVDIRELEQRRSSYLHREHNPRSKSANDNYQNDFTKSELAFVAVRRKYR